MVRLLAAVAVGLLLGLCVLEWRHTAEIAGIRAELGRLSQRTGPDRSAGSVAIPPIVIDVSSSPVAGSPSAPVALAVFSDFVCPACGRFARTTHPALTARFGDRIAIFFKFAAILDHPFSRSSAAMAACAGVSGRFWQVHDLLFAPRAPRDQTTLLLSAESRAGLSPAALETCASGPGLAAVSRDLALADSLGVHSTPTIFIGTLKSGQLTAVTRVSGAQDASVFVAAIDAALGAVVTGER